MKAFDKLFPWTAGVMAATMVIYGGYALYVLNHL